MLLLVKLQFLATHEDPVTRTTAQHLLLLVHIADVHLEYRLPIKHSATDQTLETIFAGMIEAMGAQIAALNEGLLTELAGERPVCSMCVQVPVERAFQRKTEIAFRTNIGSLVCVHAPMLDQGTVGRESLLAMLTRKWTFFVVHPLVNLQQ